MNREKQDIMTELSALASDSGTKSSFLQYIPKDLKVDCRLYLDVVKAPVFLLYRIGQNCFLLLP